jgi:amino acid transporter
MTAATPAAAEMTLRREVGFWETASLSIGVMAPSLAMSVTGAAAASLIGRAAPLAFLLAAIGVLFVSYGFRKLSGEFASAGSVYAFVGNTLGRRAGLVTGWALLGTYIVFPPVSIMGIAIFGKAFLHSTGLAHSADWFPIALAGWAVIGVLAARRIRPTTRSLLVFEIATVGLILILVGVIYVRLFTHTAPHDLRASLDVLRLPAGVSTSTVALAATSGFLAFAGFESAGSLGEEARLPKQQIPRSILTAVLFGGVFYVVCMVAQSLGFGTNASGVSAFSGSAAPLGDLAQDYIGKPMSDLLDLGATISAVGAGLGGVIVAARMMFAMAREGVLPRQLARVSASTATPRRALVVEMAIGLALLVGFRLEGTTALHVFFYLATIGVLNLLVMYVLTNIAAADHLRQRDGMRAVALPLFGSAIAAYVLYRNVWPVPPKPFNVLPYIVASWLAIGVLVAVFSPQSQALSLPTLEPAPEAIET